MSNVTTTQFALPAVATRGEVKTMIAELRADVAGALASVSTEAARQSFVATAHAIALQRAVFGSRAIYDAIVARAKTLPDYKVGKDGTVKGRLGKLLDGYGQALAVGAALQSEFPQMQDECQLALISNSPTFAGLIEPPKAAAPKEPSKDDVEKAPKAEAKAEAKPEAAPAAGNESSTMAGLHAWMQADATHEAAWAAYGDALVSAAAESKRFAREPNRRDLIVGAFNGMTDDEKAAIVAELAALVGLKLTASRKRA